MEVELLTVPKKRAEEEFEALKELLKTGKKQRVDGIYSDYRKLYGHMRHGKKVIDVYESFKKAGLTKDGNPKLAIVRADSKRVLCEEHSDGSATFYHDRGGRDVTSWRFLNRTRGDKDDVKVPSEIFMWLRNEHGTLQYGRVSTIVPVIPAKILVNEIKVLLKNFHIIWEVEKWKPVPPRDPILVKRLTPNLFGVLATWDLTELERAVIRGRIQT